MKTHLCVAAGVLVVVGAAAVSGAEGYPADARGFAGMVVGTVTAKANDELTVQVTRIERVWKHNKAEDAESLVGKQVTLRLNPEVWAKKPGYEARVRQFFSLLKAGDTESFDVKHSAGDVLIFLELTAAQLERVEKSSK